MMWSSLDITTVNPRYLRTYSLANLPILLFSNILLGLGIGEKHLENVVNRFVGWGRAKSHII